MDEKVRMDGNSHLILQRTSKEQVEKGITVIARGKGVWVYDQEGKRYLDLVAGVTRPVHVGYGRKEIAQAVYDQLCELSYFTPMQFANVPAIRLAEVLAGIAPGRINQFSFFCDGSEAVEAAMKLAKHYHHFRGDKKRFKIISRRGAYHGVTAGALRALGTVLPMRQIMEPLAPGAVFVDSPYCYRCPIHLTYPGCAIACAQDIEKAIEFEDPEQVSAFIGEPIQQGFGAYAPPKEYWKIVRNICDKFGILLIIDEVICGFGRTGKWFGIEHFDIEPDILTMAKGISSGYVPLGAMGCTDRVWEPIEVFQHLHTYGNHPVACAAALKNIEILKDERLIENSRQMGIYFLERLKTLERHPIVGEVRGTGLWTAVDLTSDKKTRALFPANRMNRIIDRAKNKGLIIKTMGHALEFAPPLIIQKEEIDQAIRTLEECITEEEKEMSV
ncbi:MAG TPA: aspartate aminotransferase family protein, partial [Thermodesulfobacteriota bacterium]|nr:aspartate aminotransferase family protein [Thermodesulfobacteriota bacterium]